MYQFVVMFSISLPLAPSAYSHTYVICSCVCCSIEVSYAKTHFYRYTRYFFHVYEAEKFRVRKKLCDKLDGIQESSSRKTAPSRTERIHFPFNLICLPDHINSGSMGGWMNEIKECNAHTRTPTLRIHIYILYCIRLYRTLLINKAN